MKVIAEIGSNFESIKDLFLSIRAAKTCGADIVKFQLFSHHDLYGYGDEEPNIDHKVIETLADKCKTAEIEFMCSAFSPARYEFINQFVSTHKIASAELSHKRILQTVNSFKKPVLLSTGASGMQDIKWALECLKDCYVTLLYCVSNYPARNIDLRVIDALRKTFSVQAGFSDHTCEALTIPYAAKLAGCTHIEKHVDFIGCKRSPDHAFSLDYFDFKNMVLHLKGDLPVQDHYLREENQMIEKHNRRIMAITDISAGEEFVEGKNIDIVRSKEADSNAVSPFMIDEIVGRKATKAIFAQDGIGPGMWS